MFCSICGKEIKMGEAYDYSQSKRQTAVFWHKRCYPIRKKNDVYGK